jgi:hypothetical protein
MQRSTIAVRPGSFWLHAASKTSTLAAGIQRAMAVNWRVPVASMANPF